ncbi:hypothetical protein K0M31_001941, partial [Melipona bicolor]
YLISDIAYVEKKYLERRHSTSVTFKSLVLKVKRSYLKRNRCKTGPKEETSFSVQQAVTSDVHTSV